jgi:hypothetical protein
MATVALGVSWLKAYFEFASEPMPTTYINFHAPVNQHTTQNLMTVVAQKL